MWGFSQLLAALELFLDMFAMLQFAAGYPAKAAPSWNPSDALEFDQFPKK